MQPPLEVQTQVHKATAMPCVQLLDALHRVTCVQLLYCDLDEVVWCLMLIWRRIAAAANSSGNRLQQCHGLAACTVVVHAAYGMHSRAQSYQVIIQGIDGFHDSDSGDGSRILKM